MLPLNGIRVIKLYAWEGTFLQKILTIRNDQELEMMRKMGYISAAQMFTWASTPFMVSLMTFSVYTLVLGKALTTDVVFAAIALFNLLQFPLAMLPWVIRYGYPHFFYSSLVFIVWQCDRSKPQAYHSHLGACCLALVSKRVFRLSVCTDS